ncbi:MAG: hypothetical protein H7Y17_06270 [Chlorobia bacterium]|nr:hypothetical protein [Fimbriimonadaceae bacterium]
MDRGDYNERESDRVMNLLGRGYAVRVFHHNLANAFIFKDATDASPGRVSLELVKHLIEIGSMTQSDSAMHYDDWRMAVPTNQVA